MKTHVAFADYLVLFLLARVFEPVDELRAIGLTWALLALLG
jgi:hypothetical protein